MSLGCTLLHIYSAAARLTLALLPALARREGSVGMALTQACGCLWLATFDQGPGGMLADRLRAALISPAHVNQRPG